MRTPTPGPAPSAATAARLIIIRVTLSGLRVTANPAVSAVAAAGAGLVDLAVPVGLAVAGIPDTHPHPAAAADQGAHRILPGDLAGHRTAAAGHGRDIPAG